MTVARLQDQHQTKYYHHHQILVQTMLKGHRILWYVTPNFTHKLLTNLLSVRELYTGITQKPILYIRVPDFLKFTCARL